MSRATADQTVLCVQPIDGELIVLSDVDLGPAAYDVAAAGTEELVRLGRWD